ncbi:MAG: hypothetical protein INR71_03465 [Terriglobus roseus]|nr:hypothetical protein [Terriglobus roseus]
MPSEYSVPTRQSLDSRRALHPTRGPSSRQERRSLDRVDAPPEEGFEDVKLNEDGKPKKKGFLGFGGQATPKSLADIEKPSSIGHHFFTGRKRGQSGGGAELSAMDRPNSRSSQVRTAVQSPGSGSGSVSGSGAAVTPAAAGTAPPAAPTATPTTPSAAAPTTSAPPAPPPIAQSDKQASAPAE